MQLPVLYTDGDFDFSYCYRIFSDQLTINDKWIIDVYIQEKSYNYKLYSKIGTIEMTYS